MSDLTRVVSSAISGAAANPIRSVTFRSTLSPSVTYTGADLTGQSSRTPGIGEFFLAALKPTFDVNTIAGTVTVAPYGEPGPLSRILAIGVAGMALGLTGTYIYRKIKKIA